MDILAKGLLDMSLVDVNIVLCLISPKGRLRLLWWCDCRHRPQAIYRCRMRFDSLRQQGTDMNIRRHNDTQLINGSISGSVTFYTYSQNSKKMLYWNDYVLCSYLAQRLRGRFILIQPIGCKSRREKRRASTRLRLHNLNILRLLGPILRH